MDALSQQIKRRLAEGPTPAERTYGWYEVEGVVVCDDFPDTGIRLSIRYSANPAITTTERFDIWDCEAPPDDPRPGPDVAPAIVLTNLEEWVATEAYFEAKRTS